MPNCGEDGPAGAGAHEMACRVAKGKSTFELVGMLGMLAMLAMLAMLVPSGVVESLRNRAQGTTLFLRFCSLFERLINASALLV
jgi:hypothetical protein